MLPYRIKEEATPRRQSKRKNRSSSSEETSSSSTNHDQGGALQRALTKDLQEMRQAFLQGLESVENHEIGNAFLVCKNIFRERRVAAWHSRFVPSRSDRGSWAQLIYASCLALLPRQMQQKNDDSKGDTPSDKNEESSHGVNGASREQLGTLAEAAFAIFSLYILHETNPLPRGEKTKGVNLLTMGLRNRENSHLLYRRHFRPWIRVDTAIFASLLHWREQARAQSSSTEDGPQNTSTVRLVAEDVLSVLENLWDHLDFVSYTGPRSLDAMAGHPDYPYQMMEQQDAQKEVRAPNRQAVVQQSDKEKYPEDSLEGLGDLQKYVQGYLDSRRSIRIPLPVDEQHRRRIDRLRQTLNPMFGDSSGTSIESLLSKIRDNQSATTVLQSKPRMVTFSIVESAAASRKDDMTEASDADNPRADQSAEEKKSGEDDQSESYELILPLGTPVPMKRSLEVAIKDLLERDSMALVGSVLPTVSVPTDGKPHNDDDGVSTLAAPSSVVTAQTGRAGDTLVESDDEQVGNADSSSVGTGAGRKALESLLGKAKTQSAIRGENVSVATSPSASSVQSRAGQAALRALLNRAQDAAGSSTASGVSVSGKKALQDLLDQAQDTGGLSVASLQSGAGQNALQALLEQAQDGEQASVATAGSTAGQEALRSLLEHAQKEPVKRGYSLSRDPDAAQSLLKKAEPISPAARPSRQSQTGRGMSFLTDQNHTTPVEASNVAENDDLSDMEGDEEDDFSVAMSSMGRRAIQDLLESADPAKQTPPKQKRRSGKSNMKRRQEPDDPPVRRAKGKAAKRKRTSARKSDESAGEDEQRSTLGNDALQQLLSRVKDNTD